MKLGLNISINVTKLLKDRFVKGEKGTYANLTTFIDTENLDQYENNGFISQSVTKEERTNGFQTPILGNVRVIYKEGQSNSKPEPQTSDMLQDVEDVPF